MYLNREHLGFKRTSASYIGTLRPKYIRRCMDAEGMKRQGLRVWGFRVRGQ